MRLTRLTITNYRALRDISIPLSRFGCLIGENNSGKSSVLLALSLFFSGTKLAPSDFFDESTPVRIAVTFDGITDSDLARLAEEHRSRVRHIVTNGRLVLVRCYDTAGRSSLLCSARIPVDPRYSAESVNSLVSRQKPGQAFVSKVVEAFPELVDKVDTSMNQEAVRLAIQDLADSLPDEQKSTADQPLPTGIDRSILSLLPSPIYIPAVKDLADDIKTTESTPFGRILSILLAAVEPKLPDTQQLFQELNSKLNCVEQPDGTVIDERLEEVRLIESTVEKFVRESFADVALRITIPPPELKAVFSSARIYANDGVEGLIESKGDGLRRAIVFSILRSYVELKTKLTPPVPGPSEETSYPPETAQPLVEPAPDSYLLLFEEPELYLYPKAQHILFDALRVFAREHHVLVSTHSPMFFTPGGIGTFVKLRKVSDPLKAAKPFTCAHPVDLSDMHAKDQFQIICFENNNAAFFADTVILVEGDSDFLVLPHIAQVLNPAWNVAQMPVVFARITGKGNIRRYRGFFTRFGVRVPVIADLDLLVSGFEHIMPDDEMRMVRDSLLARADELTVVKAADNAYDLSMTAIKESHRSAEFRGLWHRVMQCRAEYEAGNCTLDELNDTVQAFFAWQSRSDRLEILKSSDDQRLLELKWKLLAMLRDMDVFVLERGAIEEYYYDDIVGADKPSRAQDFCAKVTCREQILDCCGEQRFDCNGTLVCEKEFSLIFGSIFGR